MFSREIPFFEYDRLYRENDRYLYVNVGLGYIFSMRLGAWPEITVITLKTGDAKQQQSITIRKCFNTNNACKACKYSKLIRQYKMSHEQKETDPHCFIEDRLLRSAGKKRPDS